MRCPGVPGRFRARCPGKAGSVLAASSEGRPTGVLMRTRPLPTTRTREGSRAIPAALGGIQPSQRDVWGEAIVGRRASRLATSLADDAMQVLERLATRTRPVGEAQPEDSGIAEGGERPEAIRLQGEGWEIPDRLGDPGAKVGDRLVGDVPEEREGQVELVRLGPSRVRDGLSPARLKPNNLMFQVVGQGCGHEATDHGEPRSPKQTRRVDACRLARQPLRCTQLFRDSDVAPFVSSPNDESTP
jgi:hypothetical protein